MLQVVQADSPNLAVAKEWSPELLITEPNKRLHARTWVAQTRTNHLLVKSLGEQFLER
jgi:hypothetical protein